MISLNKHNITNSRYLFNESSPSRNYVGESPYGIIVKNYRSASKTIDIIGTIKSGDIV